jgi:hypothetical protein
MAAALTPVPQCHKAAAMTVPPVSAGADVNRQCRFIGGFESTFPRRSPGATPGCRAYTLFNEPFVTRFLADHQAIWPPYRHGLEGFVALLANVLPALVEATQGWRAALPGARHLWVGRATIP